MPSAQATPSQRTPGVGKWRKRMENKPTAYAGHEDPGSPVCSRAEAESGHTLRQALVVTAFDGINVHFL